MRLHGHASALDLKVLHYEMWRVRGDVKAQQRMLDLAMETLETNIVTLIDGMRKRHRSREGTGQDESASDDHSSRSMTIDFDSENHEISGILRLSNHGSQDNFGTR